MNRELLLKGAPPVRGLFMGLGVYIGVYSEVLRQTIGQKAT